MTQVLPVCQQQIRKPVHCAAGYRPENAANQPDGLPGKEHEPFRQGATD